MKKLCNNDFITIRSLSRGDLTIRVEYIHEGNRIPGRPPTFYLRSRRDPVYLAERLQAEIPVDEREYERVLRLLPGNTSVDTPTLDILPIEQAPEEEPPHRG